MDPKIRLAPDGPLVVTGVDTFTDPTGKPIEVRPTMRLCRCGASSTKPFCDATHTRVRFTDGQSASRIPDRRDDYQGDEVTIHDNRGICSHAGYCTAGLPAVWSYNEPWIDPNGAERGEIVELVKLCPSGALSFSVDGVASRDQERPPALRLTQDGPYVVTGSIELEGVEWLEGASQEHYTLCRCGASKNKPFCDGSHWYVDFKHGDAASPFPESQVAWKKVADLDEVPEGRVKTVTIGTRSFAVTKVGGEFGVLSNKCPHQGGPLGEGTIDDGCLRCPWHGWEFDALTGDALGDHSDGVVAFEHETREDGLYAAITEQLKHIRTVSDVMAETMVEWGVDVVFGMVGHSNLGLADALRMLEEQDRLRYIGVRHEGAAAFAASGYAKLTGRPAACLGIAGPGSTNLLTGLWDAKVDRAPILALSGQVNTQVLGPGAFQEIDLAAAFAPVAKFSQTVLHDSSHAELMALAIKTAVVERDVAHLIFPDEVQVHRAGDGVTASSPEGRLSPTAIAPPAESVEAASERIARSEHPVIIVGYGARDGMQHIIELAARIGAPVITTFKAKGQISDRHHLAGGVLGRSGTPIASYLMNRADLLVVFGASFSNHTGIDSAKDIIQVDYDRMALGKFHPVTIPVWGEVSVTTRLITGSLPRDLKCQDWTAVVAERWDLWRAEKARRRAETRSNGINSATIFEALGLVVPDDAVIAVDVGNNTYSFGRYFECRAQRVLMSGYLGSIGFAFPAAMGAWAGAEGKKVISISGDGGFGQYMNEFTTAVKYGMDITHILLNNAELGKISKEQRGGEWPVWQTSLHNPSFSEYAKLCGGFGIRVTDPNELQGAFEAALDVSGPSLVEIIADPLLI